MNLKEELNDKQYEAASCTQGPLLILAGAGSGKTRVLTYRIAHLVKDCGVNPANILAITFTNKAAREMAERVENLLEGDIYGMWVHTFHAACGRILRSHAEKIGYNGNFVIYDDSETSSVIKEILKRRNFDAKELDPKIVKNAIAKAKDRMLTPKMYAEQIDVKDKYESRIAVVYEDYQKTLVANNAMDFDDMILNVIKIFRENPDVLEYYQNRFRYILVDEYQDTNMPQYVLVSLLARKYRNLCVVGDDDQSIYSFRGADVTNILNFEKDYPECRTVRLEQNYRSTQNILSAANSVIKNNISRKAKKLWTAAGDGDQVELVESSDHNAEAAFICSKIKEGVNAGDASYSDFTVLYRVNSLAQNIESALMRMNIPYRVYGGLRFFERKEIKDIVAYLRVLENPADDVALKRIINVPRRGIGETSISRAEEIAVKEGLPLFTVLAGAAEYPALSRAAMSMTSFAEHIMNAMMKKDDMAISDFVEYLIDDMELLRDYSKDRSEEAQARMDNIKEFLSVAKEFESDQNELSEGQTDSYSAFLESIALSTDFDTPGEDTSYVSLMTMHNAKGLEFHTVFVIGMEESLFPSERSVTESESGLEEERRLCYVAITRAKKKLYLMNCKSRLLYGQTKYNMPSRFLREIPDDYVSRTAYGDSYGSYYGGESFSYGRKKNSFSESSNRTSYAGSNSFAGRRSNNSYGNSLFGKRIENASDVKKYVDTQHKFNTVKPEGDKDFIVGDRVNHKKFGDGTVTSVTESDKKVIEVTFDDAGLKRFALEYVELKKI